MGKIIQITGVDEELRVRFRTLCVKEGRSAKEMLLALLNKYEVTPPVV